MPVDIGCFLFITNVYIYFNIKDCLFQVLLKNIYNIIEKFVKKNGQGIKSSPVIIESFSTPTIDKEPKM